MRQYYVMSTKIRGLFKSTCIFKVTMRKTICEIARDGAVSPPPMGVSSLDLGRTKRAALFRKADGQRYRGLNKVGHGCRERSLGALHSPSARSSASRCSTFIAWLTLGGAIPKANARGVCVHGLGWQGRDFDPLAFVLGDQGS